MITSYKQVLLLAYPEATCLQMVDNYFSDGTRYEVLSFDPSTPQAQGLRPKLLGIGDAALSAWKDAYEHLPPVEQAKANSGVWTLTPEEQAEWVDELPLLGLDQGLAQRQALARKKALRKAKANRKKRKKAQGA
jgi:hypothetical protein